MESDWSKYDYKVELNLPWLFPEARACFPDFDYHKPLHPELCDMSRPDNIVGEQQRAFSVWWAMDQCLASGRIGIDIGSASEVTPWTIGIDYYRGEEHPIYGGVCEPTLVCDGENLSMFADDFFTLVIANHSLEHMKGDIVELLRTQWLRVLEPSRYLVMIIPSNEYFDVLAADPSHVNAWTAAEFQEEIIKPLLDMVRVREFNTLNNNFSFDVVLRKNDRGE